MKLRFRKNSLRLRVNQREVEALAAGTALEEQVHFPGDGNISYILQPVANSSPDASFDRGVIRVSAPASQIRRWAGADSIGMYFELMANGSPLNVAIEKDLVCLDGPEGERDPEAFPRDAAKEC